MRKVFLIILAAIVLLAAAVSANNWQRRPAITNKDINAVDMVTTDNGWAVGYWGEIMHYNGSAWSIYYTWPISYLQDVDFETADFGVAVGASGEAAVFNGSSWSSAVIPSTSNFYAVGIPLGQTNVAWACGSSGHLWKRQNGVWTRTTLSTSANLHDIYWSSETDGWLCGDSGRVYHYTGGSWSAVSFSTTANFYCIYALGPTNVWVGGSNGSLYHYEGVTWAPVATPTNKAIREMSFQGPTAGWAVCDGGSILRYNGISWSEVNIYPTTSLNFAGLNMPTGDDGWAVGQQGNMYHYYDNDAVVPSSLGKVKTLFH